MGFKVLDFIWGFFLGREEESVAMPVLEVDKAIEEIKKSEEEALTEPGRIIYKGTHNLFEIRLDRDIRQTYRFTVFQGTERVYSFSVFSDPTDFNSLSTAFERIITFLDSDQKISNLPDNELIKGHFYGRAQT